MKKISLLFFIVLSLSCQNQNKETNIPVSEQTVITDSITAPKPVSKFMFMGMTTIEPISLHTSSYDGKKDIIMGNKQHTTDIMEVNEEITEDFKYRELDSAEKDLRDNTLKTVKSKYEAMASAYGIEMPTTETRILSRNIYVFDSYAEASKARQRILQN